MKCFPGSTSTWHRTGHFLKTNLLHTHTNWTTAEMMVTGMWNKIHECVQGFVEGGGEVLEQL